jgi:hypothetical protein
MLASLLLQLLVYSKAPEALPVKDNRNSYQLT